MSGFGLWQLRRWGRSTGRLAITGLLLFVIAAALACGSDPEPAPTPEPDQPASDISPAIEPTPPSEPAEPRNASPAKVTLPPPVALDSLPSLADLVEKVKPAVASISVESISRGLFFDFSDQDAGSGLVIRPDGYVATNFHVIQNATDIQVTLANGVTYDGVVVGQDTITDLAVIKIDAENLPTATFGNSDRIKVGDWVVALGNALALKGGPTVTLGIVSARGRTISTERGQLYDLIQTDAAINDGNSGGPLVNLNGEVIGISTAILRQAQGIGFAVSSTVARPILNSLIEHGRVVRPLIGLTGADVTPARANQLNLTLTEGVIVTRAPAGGPAYKAGLRVGDVITRIDDIPTPDMARFLTLLWTYDVGKVVQVEYTSNNETRIAAVQLAARPAD